MKKITIMLIAALCLTALPGCSWMGRTAGKVQGKIERKANDLESGYNKGYRDEKGKGASAKPATSAPEKEEKKADPASQS